MSIHRTADAIDLSEVSRQICSSSNFRMAWQFYRISDSQVDSSSSLRRLLAAVAAERRLHQFLYDSRDLAEGEAFWIEPLHDHCVIRECTEDFTDTFARAAYDHLGAYSKVLRESTSGERLLVRSLFSKIGDFKAFSVVPGDDANCPICQTYNHDVFSNWFYDVAWDYTFFVTWPALGLVCLICLTDTD